MKKKLRKFLLSGLSGLLILNSSPLIPSVSASDICGDANNDGNVDLTDVTYISQYIRSQVNSINLKNADVDRNAVIDINDIKILQSYVMGCADLPNNATGNYNLPTDNTRWYTKYNLDTGHTSSYRLPASTTSNLSYEIDDRVVDASGEATCIVRLMYTRPNGSLGGGTGFIVDDHIIATAAHCLYDVDNRGFNTDIKIYPFYENGHSFSSAYYAKETHIPDNFILDNIFTTADDRNSEHDYGLIYCDIDLSQWGKMPLGITTNDFKNTAATVYVSGYPDNTEILGRYVGNGSILSSSTSRLLHYDVFTSSGDSGGPVYMKYMFEGQEYRSAIGIHVFGGNIDQHYNCGPRISRQLLRFYYNNSNIG